ncbi:MAG: queuosine precursor transporter [Bacteroidales bacterium]|nr:queuosine precursor transporter [Bacteroidales bacterium]
MNKQVSVIFMVTGILFTVCLIVANIVESKLINVFGVTATAGLIIFPVSYILNDVIAEVWGYQKARLIIWIGFAMNFLAVTVFNISIILPASPFFENQHAFQTILGNTQRIATASFIAFLCGSFLNAFIMSRMKMATQGRGFSVRAVVSTLFGESLDSLVFFTIAFYGVLPNSELLILIGTQTAMKTGYEVIALPITNVVVKWVKKVENTDVYDQNISYNPLKIGEI